MTNKKQELAVFIAGKVKASTRTQGEIARDAGIPNQNFLSMICSGKAKVPLARVPALADALGVPRVDLLWRVLLAHEPEVADVLESVLPDMPRSADEVALVRGHRVLKQKGIIDEDGCELRGLRPKGRASGWARISRE